MCVRVYVHANVYLYVFFLNRIEKLDRLYFLKSFFLFESMKELFTVQVSLFKAFNEKL